MKLLMILVLFGSCALGAAMVAQVSSSSDPTDGRIADLIAKVQDVPASKLDSKLPAIRLQDWVRASAGPDANISWSFRRGVPSESNHLLDLPDCVDVHAMTKDGRSFHLSIGIQTSTNADLLFWHGGAVKVQQRSIGLEHLSQLPRLLNGAGQKVHSSGVQK